MSNLKKDTLSRWRERVGVRVVFTALLATFFHASFSEETSYRVGQGIADITGPPVDIGMMGYASLWQKTSGIHTRLWSRAFVIEDQETRNRIVFVSADLGMIFQAVKREVVKRLQELYGDHYSDANVMLTATHTHCGPGGYSEHSLYNTPIGGFDNLGFGRIVDGIVQSITQAIQNLKPATIKIASGDLLGASTNRSLPAYLYNPKKERDQYSYPFDATMLLLRFEDANANEVGLVNWFGVHPTSLGKQVTLISSDNKGLASFWFERDKGKSFVAAFAQGLAGDVSPNVFGPQGTFGKLQDDFKGLSFSAEKQYKKAKELYEKATESVSGPIYYRHTFMRFPNVNVDKRWTDGRTPQKTCSPALGWSFTAGAEDGPSGLPAVYEGMVATEKDPCHQEKKLTGVSIGSRGWYTSPEILPIQLFVLGDLAIVGLPFEVTTMSGRRMKKQLIESLEPLSVRYVVVSTLANAYAQYLTTREEYAAQHYEGASNQFGPWTLSAIQQELDKLAQAIVLQMPIEGSLTPPDLSGKRVPVGWPSPVASKTPGIHEDVDTSHSYLPGDVVRVSFLGGYPNWSLNILKTFLEIRNIDTQQIVAFDFDPETTFHWQRKEADGLVTMTWRIPKDVVPGRYKMIHRGHRLDELGKKILYEVESSEFTVSTH